MKRAIVTAMGFLLLIAACSRGPTVDPRQVTAALVPGELPVEDPGASVWSRATEHPAAMMVQDVTEPRLIEPGVPLVKVRALHNGQAIVFRLEWEDATEDLIPQSGLGSDGVAIQLPTVPGADVPNAAMGETNRRVHIAFWKAVWQQDAALAAQAEAEGGQPKDRIAALYPNAAIDHYPYLASEKAREEMEKRYTPAAAAGNPITVRPNAGAVQELIAEGFGTTTVAPTQKASGRGAWSNGRWAATIARPLQEGEGLANLTPGERTYVALAVWDGSARHMGARKMRSGWIPLELAGE